MPPLERPGRAEEELEQGKEGVKKRPLFLRAKGGEKLNRGHPFKIGTGPDLAKS